jgi:hypothetical protein
MPARAAAGPYYPTEARNTKQLLRNLTGQRFCFPRSV